MGYNTAPSELYETAWDRYCKQCESTGLQPLNVFCRGINIDVRRMYDWLRHHNISLSKIQRTFKPMDGSSEVKSTEPLFVNVTPEDATNKGKPDTYGADVSISLRSGDTVNIPGISIIQLSNLITEINRRSDVVSGK